MTDHRGGGMAEPATAPDREARRAQVVAALADALRPAERTATVRVAIDAVTSEVAPALADELADELAGTLSASGVPAGRATARRHGRAAAATLVLADARRLPLRDGSVDAVFAAGLLPHLLDPDAGLTGIARVVRPGGRLCLFHPSGRAALAARHGRRVRGDDLLAESSLRGARADRLAPGALPRPTQPVPGARRPRPVAVAVESGSPSSRASAGARRQARERG